MGDKSLRDRGLSSPTEVTDVDKLYEVKGLSAQAAGSAPDGFLLTKQPIETTRPVWRITVVVRAAHVQVR